MNMEPAIQMISIELIIPNRFQPRLAFDEQALNELSSSIKEHGIIQPLVLRRLGDKYEIIAGERRYKAATMAGLTEVPAIIANLDDNQSAEVALVENVQRKDLSSIEEAKSYKRILDKGYLTQEELAKKMGITQSTVANKLRLLNLTDDVQEALMNDKISERHARSLLQLTVPNEQKNMLVRIIGERLTVRQLDEEIKKLVNSDPIIETKKEDVNVNQNQPLEPSNQSLTPLNTELETLDFDTPISDVLPSFEPAPSLPMFESSTPSFFDTEPVVNDAKIETLDFDELLNSIAPKEKTEVENIVPEKKINIFDRPTFPSLEDEVVNMNMDVASNAVIGFNPFGNNNDINITTEKAEELESPKSIAQSIVKPSTTEQKPTEEDKKIKIDDLSTVTKAIEELEAEIKEVGYKISTESFDFEDLYQVIIKIDKTG